MDLESWMSNIIWKLPWNDSEVLLEILELDLGSFFYVKVYLFNIFFNLKPIFYKIWVSEVISQHLLINLDLGPTLKCAPGHDSIEDSSIIKSYWLKSRVVGLEKWFSAFRPFLELTSTTLHSVQTFSGNFCTEWTQIKVQQIRGTDICPKCINLWFCADIPWEFLHRSNTPRPLLCAEISWEFLHRISKKSLNFVLRVASLSAS